MYDAIYALNWTLTRGFDLLFRPLHFLGPFWSLTLLSLLTGLFMVWIFGRVSDQAAIVRIRNTIRGNLIAVRLFQNDIRVFLSIQARILRDTLTYMRYSLKPMLILMIPLILIIVQLHLHYHYRPIGKNEKTLVTARFLKNALPEAPSKVALVVPDGITVETPGVWVPSEREISWRIRADKEGTYKVGVVSQGHETEKELIVGSGWGSVSPIRFGRRFLDLLLYPKEPPIDPNSGIESVGVIYPELDIRFLGIGVDWLVAFFVLSIAFGFATKGLLGVQV